MALDKSRLLGKFKAMITLAPAGLQLSLGLLEIPTLLYAQGFGSVIKLQQYCLVKEQKQFLSVLCQWSLSGQDRCFCTKVVLCSSDNFFSWNLADTTTCSLCQKRCGYIELLPEGPERGVLMLAPLTGAKGNLHQSLAATPSQLQH